MNLTNVIGNDKGLLDLLKQVEIIAPQNITVLLLGESGVGKEVIARTIHENSARKDKPFIAVNCMALSRSPVGFLSLTTILYSKTTT